MLEHMRAVSESFRDRIQHSEANFSIINTQLLGRWYRKEGRGRTRERQRRGHREREEWLKPPSHEQHIIYTPTINPPRPAPGCTSLLLTHTWPHNSHHRLIAFLSSKHATKCLTLTEKNMTFLNTQCVRIATSRRAKANVFGRFLFFPAAAYSADSPDFIHH